jgi:hypothetical protein
MGDRTRAPQEETSAPHLAALRPQQKLAVNKGQRHDKGGADRAREKGSPTLQLGSPLEINLNQYALR